MKKDSQKPSKAAANSDVILMFYQVMGAAYKSKFEGVYPPLDTREAVIIEWLFKPISVDQCRSGIDKWMSNPEEWPPEPARFVRLCLGLDSSHDHKAIHDDYMQNHSHKSLDELRRFNWPSPLAYFVTLASADEIKKLHLVKLGNHDAKKTMSIFEKHYQHYAPQSKDLVIPEALVEDKKTDPSHKEVVEEWRGRWGSQVNMASHFNIGPSQENA